MFFDDRKKVCASLAVCCVVLSGSFGSRPPTRCTKTCIRPEERTAGAVGLPGLSCAHAGHLCAGGHVEAAGTVFVPAFAQRLRRHTQHPQVSLSGKNKSRTQETKQDFLERTRREREAREVQRKREKAALDIQVGFRALLNSTPARVGSSDLGGDLSGDFAEVTVTADRRGHL
jgi:hypothetical protein